MKNALSYHENYAGRLTKNKYLGVSIIQRIFLRKYALQRNDLQHFNHIAQKLNVLMIISGIILLKDKMNKKIFNADKNIQDVSVRSKNFTLKLPREPSYFCDTPDY